MCSSFIITYGRGKVNSLIQNYRLERLWEFFATLTDQSGAKSPPAACPQRFFAFLNLHGEKTVGRIVGRGLGKLGKFLKQRQFAPIFLVPARPHSSRHFQKTSIGRSVSLCNTLEDYTTTTRSSKGGSLEQRRKSDSFFKLSSLLFSLPFCTVGLWWCSPQELSAKTPPSLVEGQGECGKIWESAENRKKEWEEMSLYRISFPIS